MSTKLCKGDYYIINGVDEYIFVGKYLGKEFIMNVNKLDIMKIDFSDTGIDGIRQKDILLKIAILEPEIFNKPN